MGWTPVNQMSIKRDYEMRLIVIDWVDDVLGKKQKCFKFEEKEEAFEFAEKTFNELCM